MALVCAAEIAPVTFVICMVWLVLGKMFGTRFAEKASFFRGIMLIVIGIEAFIKQYYE